MTPAPTHQNGAGGRPAPQAQAAPLTSSLARVNRSGRRGPSRKGELCPVHDRETLRWWRVLAALALSAIAVAGMRRRRRRQRVVRSQSKVTIERERKGEGTGDHRAPGADRGPGRDRADQ